MKSPKRSLIAAVFKTFWKEYSALSVMAAFSDIFCLIAQTILLGRLLLYFR